MTRGNHCRPISPGSQCTDLTKSGGCRFIRRFVCGGLSSHSTARVRWVVVSMVSGRANLTGAARPHCRAVYHRRCSLVSRDIKSFAVSSRVRSSSAFTSTGSTLACWGRLECPEYGWVWVTQHFGTGTGNSRGRWCLTHRIGPSGPCCQACSGWWTSVDVRSASTSSGSARRRRSIFCCRFSRSMRQSVLEWQLPFPVPNCTWRPPRAM